MRKNSGLLFGTIVTATLIVIVSCSTSGTKQQTNTNASAGMVAWLHDSGGGTHPDTLLVRYPARDCTRIASVMFVSDSGGGTHPDTLLVEKIVFKGRKQKP